MISACNSVGKGLIHPPLQNRLINISHRRYCFQWIFRLIPYRSRFSCPRVVQATFSRPTQHRGQERKNKIEKQWWCMHGEVYICGIHIRIYVDVRVHEHPCTHNVQFSLLSSSKKFPKKKKKNNNVRPYVDIFSPSAFISFFFFFKGIHLHEQTYECVYIHICCNE